MPEQLQRARASASHIYKARVSKVEGEECSGTASVEVTEVFKGEVPRVVRLSSGGCGDCTFPFEPGKGYLLYARGGVQGVGLCGRTREVTGDDAEQRWLRTGVLPPAPVALRRELVSCRRCDLTDVADALMPPNADNKCSPRWLHREDAIQAFRKIQPFWTGGYYDRDDLSRRVAVGLSTELQPFQLVQTPANATEEICRQRVIRHSCERLGETQGSDVVDGIQCIEPGPGTVVCDELPSRRASWGPLESLEGADCEWRDPSRPICELSEKQTLRSAQSAPGPILWCRPAYDSGRRTHACVVLDETSGAP